MPNFSREEGDQSLYTDAMYNFIPGSCFEIGVSLEMLDKPGHAGSVIDKNAREIQDIIVKVYNTPLGKQTIRISPNANPIKLIDYFNTKILKELNPASDQIGRCLDMTKKENWFSGEGLQWLNEQLSLPSDSDNYNYTNMLTKIRTISAFGTILRELMPNNKNTIAELTGKDENIIIERNNQIINQVRHEGFDNPKTRARTEKMPIMEGKPLNDYEGVKINLTDAGPKGLGFGQIWHADAMEATDHSGEKAIERYKELEETKGRQGMPRRGQDIKDSSRPGIIGESAIKKIPQPFQNTKLADQLQSHQFEHGSGVNRWQLHGEYTLGSWDQSMPAAGAHSGGTSDVFLAMNCVNDDSIFGQEDAKDAGLLISSFMNFGGYHSFVETFPIAQSIASNSTFKVEVTEKQKSIYEDIQQTILNSSQKAAQNVNEYWQAYNQSKKEMRQASEKNIPSAENRTLDALDLAQFDPNKPKLIEEVSILESDSDSEEELSIPMPESKKLAQPDTQIKSKGELAEKIGKIGKIGKYKQELKENREKNQEADIDSSIRIKQ